jgi:hypothetical protein
MESIRFSQPRFLPLQSRSHTILRETGAWRFLLKSAMNASDLSGSDDAGLA